MRDFLAVMPLGLDSPAFVFDFAFWILLSLILLTLSLFCKQKANEIQAAA